LYKNIFKINEIQSGFFKGFPLKLGQGAMLLARLGISN
jgi:hypothetical protein